MAITIKSTKVSSGQDLLTGQQHDIVDDLNELKDALEGSYGVPVGAIIPWWAPNNSFSSPTGFAVCDGSAIASGPYTGNNTPNLVNRFLMGVSHSNVNSSGGSNTKNLSHTHVTNISHNHGSHTHGRGSYHAQIGFESGALYQRRENVPGWTATHGVVLSGIVGTSNGLITGSRVWGTSAATTVSLGTTNKTSTSSLSNSFDIRPSYIGVVYLMRIS